MTHPLPFSFTAHTLHTLERARDQIQDTSRTAAALAENLRYKRLTAARAITPCSRIAANCAEIASRLTDLLDELADATDDPHTR